MAAEKVRNLTDIRQAVIGLYPDNVVTQLPRADNSAAIRLEVAGVASFRISSTLFVEEIKDGILAISGLADELQKRLRQHFKEEDKQQAKAEAEKSARKAAIVVNVRADFMKALWPMVGHGDLRYYLNGFCITPHPKKGVFIHATNGHIAGTLYDENGVCETEVIVNLDKSALGKIRAGDSFCINSGRAFIYRAGREVFVQPGDPFIDGKFPNVPKLIDGKQFVEGITEAVQFEYIEMCKLTALNPRYSGLKFWHEVEGSMIVVRNEGVQEFIGLVMPMRGDIDAPIPDWFKA